MNTVRVYWLALAFYGGVSFLTGIEALLTATATIGDWGQLLGGSVVALTAGIALTRNQSMDTVPNTTRWLGIGGALLAGLALLGTLLA